MEAGRGGSRRAPAKRLPDGEFAPKGLGRVLDPSQEGQTVGSRALSNRRVKGTPEQERARGERNARMKALTPRPTSGNIVGMNPTKTSHGIDIADAIHELSAGESLRLADGRQVVRTRSTQSANYDLKDAQGHLLPGETMSYQEVLDLLGARH